MYDTLEEGTWGWRVVVAAHGVMPRRNTTLPTVMSTIETLAITLGCLAIRYSMALRRPNGASTDV
jgi:hypothetical protein